MVRPAWLSVMLIVAALRPAPSSACSPSCREESLVSVVPANVTALPIFARNAVLYRADDGGLVPSVVGSSGLVPDAPLDPDTDYFVELTSTCDGGVQRLPLRTGAVASLPTSIGNVALAANVVGTLHVATSCGQCSVDLQASSVRVTVNLLADFGPWESTTRFALFVDGGVFSQGAIASFLGGSRGIGVGPTDAGTLEYVIHGRCNQQPQNFDDDGLPLGTYTGDVRRWRVDSGEVAALHVHPGLRRCLPSGTRWMRSVRAQPLRELCRGCGQSRLWRA
jgi:hypothetical protein